MSDPIFNVEYSMREVHRRRLKRRIRFVIFIFLLLVCLVLLLIFELRRTSKDANNQIGKTYIQHVGVNSTTYKSPYFQFSDTNTWVNKPDQSDPSEIVFTMYVSKLPTQLLEVFINQTPLQYELAVNHALPVQVVNGKSFTVGNMSDNCVGEYKPTDPMNIRSLTISGTNILCVPDSSQYTAVVGQIGGNYNLALKRTNGEIANYVIIYHNLTVTPDPTSFINIMKTFEAL